MVVLASPLAIASSTRLSCDDGLTMVRISMATACSVADETPSTASRSGPSATRCGLPGCSITSMFQLASASDRR